MALAAASACTGSPTEQVVENGPDGFTVVSSPDAHDQYFPITSGAHSGTDCNTCHATTDQGMEADSFTQFSCFKGCHDHDRSVTDPAHAGMSGYGFESAKCYSCHPRGMADSIDRATHDQYFHINTGSAHESTSCASCHTDPNNRQHVECISCHDHDQAPMATRHQGITNYQWADQACLSCHPKGDVNFDRASHDQYFHINTGTPHANTACASCHTDPNNRQHVECISCHDHAQAPMATTHQGITGYQWTDQACLTCHPKGDVNFDRASHDQYFHINTGTPHANTACASCHTDPNNRQHVECISCHDHGQSPMQSVHNGITGYRWSDQACLTCHPKGDVNFDRASHDQYFFIQSGTAHGNVACEGCHTDPNNRQHVECISCHDHAQAATAAIHTGISGYAYRDADCRRCHPRGDVNYDRSTHQQYFPINTGSVHESAACSSCHTNPSNRQTVSCVGCHEHDQATMSAAHSGRLSNYTYTSAACMRCHWDSSVMRVASHPRSQVSVTHGGRPSHCLDCHDRYQGPPRTWAADFTETNCSHNTAHCHDD